MTSSGSRKRPDALVVGLTGGIASGKSTVSALLRELGAVVICADQLAREVVAPGSAGLAAIVARFGAEFVGADGALDRSRLGDLVFSDPAARRDLEAILHPLIREAFAAGVARAHSGNPGAVVVYDAPLLIEAGAHREVDKVMVVRVDEATQLKRLMARDGLTEVEARGRIHAQMSDRDRLSHANAVLDGTEPPDSMRRTLQGILREWGAERDRAAGG